ncbi:hypothetical protein [Actinocorallia herbida]|uniref:hypothetical protein n=1 Tax=Actinocorallia herbida TaxID=58109 RepID=UPI001476E159|nr:hypothetical protein [Actinocorallia herbida]
MGTLPARITRPWTRANPVENTTYNERRGSQVCTAACRRAAHRDRVVTAALRSRL